MTDVRMFSEPEAAEIARKAIERFVRKSYPEMHGLADVIDLAVVEAAVDEAMAEAPSTLRAHGASKVAGATLMDVDEGQQILVPTAVADGIYAVAEHFGVSVRSLVTELQTEVRRRRAADT